MKWPTRRKTSSEVLCSTLRFCLGVVVFTGFPPANSRPIRTRANLLWGVVTRRMRIVFLTVLFDSDCRFSTSNGLTSRAGLRSVSEATACRATAVTMLRRRSEFFVFLDSVCTLKPEQEAREEPPPLTPFEEYLQTLLQMKMTSAVSPPSRWSSQGSALRLSSGNGHVH